MLHFSEIFFQIEDFLKKWNHFKENRAHLLSQTFFMNFNNNYSHFRIKIKVFIPIFFPQSKMMRQQLSESNVNVYWSGKKLKAIIAIHFNSVYCDKIPIIYIVDMFGLWMKVKNTTLQKAENNGVNSLGYKYIVCTKMKQNNRQ